MYYSTTLSLAGAAKIRQKNPKSRRSFQMKEKMQSAGGMKLTRMSW